MTVVVVICCIMVAYVMVNIFESMQNVIKLTVKQHI